MLKKLYSKKWKGNRKGRKTDADNKEKARKRLRSKTFGIKSKIPNWLDWENICRIGKIQKPNSSPVEIQ